MPSPVYQFTEEDARILRDMREWQRNFSLAGPGVTFKNTSKGANAYIGQKKTPPSQQRSVGGTLVKVTGNAVGGGKYTGTVWADPTPTNPVTPFPTAGNLAEVDIGQAGDAVLIVNTSEIGLSTHDLTTGTPRIKIFPAHRSPRMSDEVPPKPVYVIFGLDIETCT